MVYGVWCTQGSTWDSAFTIIKIVAIPAEDKYVDLISAVSDSSMLSDLKSVSLCWLIRDTALCRYSQCFNSAKDTEKVLTLSKPSDHRYALEW
jgi:hypothetical protein